MNTKRLGNLDWLEALSYDSPFERGQDPFGRAKAFCRAGAWVRLLECCLRVAVMVKLLSRNGVNFLDRACTVQRPAYTRPLLDSI